MTPSLDPEAERRTRFALDLAQHTLLLLSIGLRPFIFGGDLSAPDQLLWHGLVLVGWLLCLLELWSGRRDSLRWAPAGLAAAVLLLVLLPAAWRAPDPSLGWGRWVSWASLLLWAGYLMQALPGRTRFAWSLLAGCLVVQIVLALAQQAHVLPAMASAMGAGDQQMIELVERVGHGDIADRIALGGTYGSMTLANILAVWLALVAIPLAGAVAVGIRSWRQRLDPRPRSNALVLGCLLLALSLAALLSTGARGAPVAVVVASGLIILRWWRSLLRWLPLLGLGLLAALVLVLPSLRSVGQASIDVRLGYWRAAAALLENGWLTGFGIGGFEAFAPAHLRPEDEYSRFAHNELVEAMVAGGLFAAVAMLAWWGRHLWARPSLVEETAESPVARWLRWLPVLVFPYMLLFGTFASDNLAWWPGGDGPGIALWAVLLGGLFGWVASAAAKLPLPPPWAVHLALASGVLACLLDFHLHDLSFAGTLVVVACLAGVGSARALPAGLIPRLGLSALVAIAAVALAIGYDRASDLRAVDRSIRLIDGYARASAQHDGEAAWAHLHDLALDAGLPPLPPQQLPSQQHRNAILHAAWQTAADQLDGWPAAPERRVELALRHPDPAARYPLLAEAVTAQAHSSTAWSLLARSALEARRWEEALAAARKAVAAYPAQLRHHLLLAQALEAAAEHRRGDPASLRAEAAELRAGIARLNPSAHPRHQVGPATLPPPPAPRPLEIGPPQQ